MRVERRLPALSSLRGQMQAQETRLASLGKRLMSVPISEMICSAARFLTPGTELTCSTAVRKGAMAASIFRPLTPMRSLITESNLMFGVFEGLLYAQDVPCLLTAQLLARAYERAHLLGGAVRYEARADKAMG